MQARLEGVKAQVQAALDRAIGDLPPGELRDAMAYACAGGKRIRAFLVLESASLHGVADEAALPVAAWLGWSLYSRLRIPHDLTPPPALGGERRTLDGRAGPLNVYVAGSGAPLLLVHAQEDRTASAESMAGWTSTGVSTATSAQTASTA